MCFTCVSEGREAVIVGDDRATWRDIVVLSARSASGLEGISQARERHWKKWLHSEGADAGNVKGLDKCRNVWIRYLEPSRVCVPGKIDH